METVKLARRGFTLIEVMIAIAIVAIIGAIVVPNVTSYIRKARVKSTRVALENIKNAIESYHADTGQYPANLSDLKTRPSDEKAAKLWDGPYIEKEPVDAWKNEYVYTLNPKGTQPRYELYSWGANGEGSPAEEWINVREA